VLVTDEPSRFCAAKEFAPQWLKRKYRSLADSRAVIGGSPGFVEACVGACAALGMPAGKMATDSFNPTAPV
jgi:CDP-4-dehydro-6-deoxyglucose reductase